MGQQGAFLPRRALLSLSLTKVLAATRGGEFVQTDLPPTGDGFIGLVLAAGGPGVAQAPCLWETLTIHLGG